MRKTTKMAVVLAAMSVMVLGAATMVSAAEKSGWVKEGSDWYFYVKDTAVKNQWALSGDEWYFLDETGKMATDVFVDNEFREVVDVRNWDPTVIADEVKYGNFVEYYYVGSDGAMSTGWEDVLWLQEVSPVEGNKKAWFYFGADGRMYANTWVLSDNVWYFMGDTGQMLSSQVVEWGDEDYYLKKDGSMVTGWYQVEEKYEIENTDETIVKDAWIYANASGALAQSEWQKINGKWYYFGTDLTAGKYNPEKPIAVSGSGISGDTKEMVGSEYTMESYGFFDIYRVRSNDHDRYFLNRDGSLATGLFTVAYGNRTDRVTNYYLADGSGVLQKGVQKVNGKFYLFGENDSSDEFVRYDHTSRDAKKYAVGNVAWAFVNDRAAKDYAELHPDVTVYKLGTATNWKYNK